MAGQPPESSWPTGGQDQTQARAAWPPPPPQQLAQAPMFTPQGGAPQDGYGYPQQPPPGYPPPGYAAPAQEQQGYAGQRIRLRRPRTTLSGSSQWGTRAARVRRGRSR